MTLQARLARLEAHSGDQFLTDAEREAAIERYTETYQALGGAFPTAIEPTAYRMAIEATRNPAEQRFLAFMLPGDDDL